MCKVFIIWGVFIINNPYTFVCIFHDPEPICAAYKIVIALRYRFVLNNVKQFIFLAQLRSTQKPGAGKSSGKRNKSSKSRDSSSTKEAKIGSSKSSKSKGTLSRSSSKHALKMQNWSNSNVLKHLWNVFNVCFKCWLVLKFKKKLNIWWHI